MKATLIMIVFLFLITPFLFSQDTLSVSSSAFAEVRNNFKEGGSVYQKKKNRPNKDEYKRRFRPRKAMPHSDFYEHMDDFGRKLYLFSDVNIPLLESNVNSKEIKDLGFLGDTIPKHLRELEESFLVLKKDFEKLKSFWIKRGSKYEYTYELCEEYYFALLLKVKKVLDQNYKLLPNKNMEIDFKSENYCVYYGSKKEQVHIHVKVYRLYSIQEVIDFFDN